MAKFQIKDCVKNFTHEPIVFAHILTDLPNIFIV